MIRTCKIALAGLLASGGGTAVADLAQVKEAGVLKVAVYEDFPPYSYSEGGTLKGVDVAIARALAERLGVGVSLMKITPDETMEDDLRNAVWKGHYLGGGIADLMMHVPVDADFAAANDKVTIFGPYFQEEVAVAYDPQRISSMDSLLVFARETVAVEVETIVDTFLSSAERGRLVHNVRHYRTIDEACDAFRDGATAAFMAARAQLENCIAADPTRFAVAPVPVPVGLFAWTVGMAVKADDKELAAALGSALDSLRADGVLQDLYVHEGLSYSAPSAPTAKTE